MKQKKFLVMGVLLIFLPVLAFANVQGKAGVDKDAVMQAVSGLQMPFIENQGQIKDKSVRFYANTFAGTVFVTDKGEIVYSLQKIEAEKMRSITSQALNFSTAKLQNSKTKAVVLRESLECPEETGIEGMNKSVTRVNYFVGSKDNWRTNIPTWQEVSLGKIYEGIELKLRAYGKNVEKLFTVYPEGSVNDIKLKMEGAKGLKVNKDGELEIETELGVVKMTKPVAYQEINGKRVQVAANYILPKSEIKNQKSEITYGFQVGEYDNTKPLVIDPLLASTFIGGSRYEEVYSFALDSSGNVFIAGETKSFDYPTTIGAYDQTCGTDGNCNEAYDVEIGYYYYADGFISKFDSNLSTLLSSTFIGGSDDDSALDLAIDSSGNVFIAGETNSSDYPTTEGAFDITHNGFSDAFISKLDSNLSSLLSSTFIGGSNYGYARALAIDSSENVFVAGYTSSSDYPTTEGAYDITHNGYSDAFVSKLDSNLSNLLSSTLIGSDGSDYPRALAIDSLGNVFVAGDTNSSNYPTTEGAFDTTHNGYWDIFVSKLDSNLSSLLSSTFIGGSGGDYPRALAIDSSGEVFIAGVTNSSDYPTTEGAYDITHNGSSDVIVSKFDSNLSSLLSSTFIGGGSNDYAFFALAIDSSENVFVAGGTVSSDYPTTEGAYDTTRDGYSSDVIVSKLDSNLSTLLSSTFIGGGSNDYAFALAIDSSGDVFVAGKTTSSDYPTTEGAFDTTYNGGVDVFISKLDSDLSADGNLTIPDISASPASKDFGSVEVGLSVSQTFTISNTGTADLIIKAVYLTGENPYQFDIQNEDCSGVIIAPSGSCTVEAVFSPTKAGALSAVLGIGSSDPDTPRLYIRLSGTGVTDGVPDISVTPASKDFGSVDVGDLSSQTFTISNTGIAALMIRAVYLTGENPYQFSIQNENCRGATIAPAGSCTVEVMFSPTKAGALSAVIGIGSNDPDTPRLYTELNGTGLGVGVPEISANPASKDFGSVEEECSIVSQTFTISNTGTADLVIKAVYLTGENPYQFSIQNENCRGAIIAPAGSCTVEVMFNPTKTGALSAILGIGSNDPDTPRLYTRLSGTGVATAGISEIVSYWKFDDGSGLTAADSADANDGTLINDPQWTTGIVGGALSFDGADDYVSVPDAVNLHITDELTIEAWILKPDDYVQVLANKNSSFNLSAGPGDTIQFNLKEQDGAGVTVGFSGSIPQNEWTHIAVTYNGKCMRAYVDGDRVGYYPLTLTIETSTDNLLIGRRLVGTPTYFKGIIDEVAIYNGALTQEEIEQHYQNGLNGLGY